MAGSLVAVQVPNSLFYDRSAALALFGVPALSLAAQHGINVAHTLIQSLPGGGYLLDASSSVASSLLSYVASLPQKYLSGAAGRVLAPVTEEESVFSAAAFKKAAGASTFIPVTSLDINTQNHIAVLSKRVIKEIITIFNYAAIAYAVSASGPILTTVGVISNANNVVAAVKKSVGALKGTINKIKSLVSSKTADKNTPQDKSVPAINLRPKNKEDDDEKEKDRKKLEAKIKAEQDNLIYGEEKQRTVIDNMSIRGFISEQLKDLPSDVQHFIFTEACNNYSDGLISARNWSDIVLELDPDVIPHEAIPLAERIVQEQNITVTQDVAEQLIKDDELVSIKEETVYQDVINNETTVVKVESTEMPPKKLSSGILSFTSANGDVNKIDFTNNPDQIISSAKLLMNKLKNEGDAYKFYEQVIAKASEMQLNAPAQTEETDVRIKPEVKAEVIQGSDLGHISDIADRQADSAQVSGVLSTLPVHLNADGENIAQVSDPLTHVQELNAAHQNVAAAVELVVNVSTDGNFAPYGSAVGIIQREDVITNVLGTKNTPVTNALKKRLARCPADRVWWDTHDNLAFKGKDIEADIMQIIEDAKLTEKERQRNEAGVSAVLRDYPQYKMMTSRGARNLLSRPTSCCEELKRRKLI